MERLCNFAFLILLLAWLAVFPPIGLLWTLGVLK